MTKIIVANTYQELLEKAPLENSDLIKYSEELTHLFLTTTLEYIEEIGLDFDENIVEAHDVHTNALVNYIGNFIGNAYVPGARMKRAEDFCEFIINIVKLIEEDN